MPVDESIMDFVVQLESHRFVIPMLMSHRILNLTLDTNMSIRKIAANCSWEANSLELDRLFDIVRRDGLIEFSTLCLCRWGQTFIPRFRQDAPALNGRCQHFSTPYTSDEDIRLPRSLPMDA